VRGTLLAISVVGGLGAGFFEELGWTGFATPRMLERSSPLRAGLLLGLVWATWHGLADYWGGAEAYGSLWPAHFLLWVICLGAYRILMTWVYSRTRSLLVGQLMHAAFTGSQMLVGPVAAPPALELVWYALFAIGCWCAVGLALLVRPPQPSPGRTRS
jgi:uncharacterized protein